MKKRNSQDATSISSGYITWNIRKIYIRRISLPILLLLVLGIIWFVFPVKSLFYAQKTDIDKLIKYPQNMDNEYISTSLENLYFTGYTSTIFGNTTGYYYYTMVGGEGLILVLSPKTCEEGLSEIPTLSITARVKKVESNMDRLTTLLADDMGWTHAGLSNQMTDIYLDETAHDSISSWIFALAYLLSGTYALIYLLLYLMAIIFPTCSPTGRKLGKFGNAKQLLAQAAEELSTLPQLATEDMFITENFFIEISKYGVAVVPINEIIWIYKHSTLHKFLWYHFVISDTLHITGNKHFYLECPKNIKSDIDGIIDYLSEANHNILVGFNEENRLKVRQMQKHGLRFEKFIHFLQRRI